MTKEQFRKRLAQGKSAGWLYTSSGAEKRRTIEDSV